MSEVESEQTDAEREAAALERRIKHGPRGARSPKQRADGEGSVFPVERKRKDGKIYTVYRATKTIELGDTRKKITAQAATAKQAIASREAKILKERVAWGLADPAVIPANPAEKKLTVADCMLYWLNERRAENLAEATIHMYDARIRNHILPAFGSDPVRGLTYPQLKLYFSETLPAKGLGPDSIRQIFICLKSALDYYLRDGILYRHPMVGLRAPNKKTKTAEDTLAIRKAADELGQLIIHEARKDGQELRWIFGLLGLRQAEVLGLTDDCFVERDGLFRLVIKQQLQRASAEHGCQIKESGNHSCGKRTTHCPLRIGENRWVLKGTKTKSGRREIALTAQLWVMIYEHIKKAKQRREQPGFHPEEGLEALIFTRADGKPIYGQRDRTALHALLAQIEYKYGFPEGMTVHTLRHMATTRLIDGGADESHLISTMGWSTNNARAQIAIYSSADYAKQAAATVQAYLDGYLNEKKPEITGWGTL